VEAIKSTSVLSEVVQRRNLIETWRTRYGSPSLTQAEALLLLRKQLDVRQSPNTSLLEIRVFSPSGQEAADIANAIAESYRSIRTQVAVSILDPAQPSPRPARPNIPLNLFLGAAAGLVLALLAGGMTFWLADSVAQKLSRSARTNSRRNAGLSTPADPAGISAAEASAAEVSHAAEQLRLPANLLLVAALLNLALFLSVRMEVSLKPWEMEARFTWTYFGSLAIAVYQVVRPCIIASALITAVGAWRMRTLRNWPLSIAAAALVAMTPPLCMIGLPLGLWTLIRLLCAENRAAFMRVAENSGMHLVNPSDAAAPALGRISMFVALFGWGLAGLFAIWVLPGVGVFPIAAGLLIPVAAIVLVPVLAWLALDGLGTDSPPGAFRNAIIGVTLPCVIAASVRFVMPLVQAPAPFKLVQHAPAWVRALETLIVLVSCGIVLALARRSESSGMLQGANSSRNRRLAWKCSTALLLAYLFLVQSPSWPPPAKFQANPLPNVTVTGMVTDAATRRPVANARVSDNRYHTSPTRAPQETWTDSDGRFSLNTWYEEHSIAASAPGYATKLATLFTKPFSHEAQVNIDFELSPAEPAENVPGPSQGRLPQGRESSSQGAEELEPDPRAPAVRLVVKQTSFMQSFPPPVLEQSPALRFVARQSQDGKAPLTNVWYPNGPLAAGEQNSRLLRFVGSQRMDISALKGGRDAPVFCFWFSHPAFDPRSDCSISIADTNGNTIPCFHGGISSSLREPSSDLEDQAWFISNFAFASESDIPPAINLRLTYSLGPWSYKQALDVAANVHQSISLPGGLVTGMGETLERQAFISVARDASQSTNMQYDFVAETRGGSRFAPKGSQLSGTDRLLTQQFEFRMPLSDIKAFHLRSRPIRTVEYRNISLQPGQPTLFLAPPTKRNPGEESSEPSREGK
jgi:hypothetical protein